MTKRIGSSLLKGYEIAGNKFQVRVQYEGNIASGHLAQQKHTWLYVLIVNGEVVHQGPWYDLQGREASNEEVCDSVASFWGDDKMIAAAQDLGDNNEQALDNVVLRCAQGMFTYYLEETFDYDIISKHMDEYGWEVTLMPNLQTAKNEGLHGRRQVVIRFKKLPRHDGVYITVYELIQSLYSKI